MAPRRGGAGRAARAQQSAQEGEEPPLREPSGEGPAPQSPHEGGNRQPPRVQLKNQQQPKQKQQKPQKQPSLPPEPPPQEAPNAEEPPPQEEGDLPPTKLAVYHPDTGIPIHPRLTSLYRSMLSSVSAADPNAAPSRPQPPPTIVVHKATAAPLAAPHPTQGPGAQGRPTVLHVARGDAPIATEPPPGDVHHHHHQHHHQHFHFHQQQHHVPPHGAHHQHQHCHQQPYLQHHQHQQAAPHHFQQPMQPVYPAAGAVPAEAPPQHRGLDSAAAPYFPPGHQCQGPPPEYNPHPPLPTPQPNAPSRAIQIIDPKTNSAIEIPAHKKSGPVRKNSSGSEGPPPAPPTAPAAAEQCAAPAPAPQDGGPAAGPQQPSPPRGAGRPPADGPAMGGTVIGAEALLLQGAAPLGRDPQRPGDTLGALRQTQRRLRAIPAQGSPAPGSPPCRVPGSAAPKEAPAADPSAAPPGESAAPAPAAAAAVGAAAPGADPGCPGAQPWRGGAVAQPSSPLSDTPFSPWAAAPAGGPGELAALQNRVQNRFVVTQPDDCLASAAKRLRGFLNRLTPEKYAANLQRLRALIQEDCRDLDLWPLIVNQVFERAVAEPHFSDLYGNLCKDLSELSYAARADGAAEPPAGASARERAKLMKQQSPFRRALLNRCQAEFEQKAEAHEGAGAEGAAPETAAPERKDRRRSLGVVKFIGELYIRGLLMERIVHNCVQRLLAGDGRADYMPGHEEIEVLCKLLITVGRELDCGRTSAAMDGYFQQLREHIMPRTENRRLRFILEGLLELRERKWQPRRSQAALHAKARKLSALELQFPVPAARSL